MTVSAVPKNGARVTGSVHTDTLPPAQLTVSTPSSSESRLSIVRPLEHGSVQRGRAEHAGLLVDGDDDLEGDGGCRPHPDRQRHGHGNAVVPAERCAARADRVAVHEEVQPSQAHVLRAVRRGLADHVHMPPQDDQGGRFIARCAGAKRMTLLGSRPEYSADDVRPQRER